jgi:beta-phosphoglucomutase-like phosphatase (HAD superfamily)
MLKPAILFDLDGVISDTASLHAEAWKATFDSIHLAGRYDFAPFRQPADYLCHFDGKTRTAGIDSFLRSRGLGLPLGHIDDQSAETMLGIGNSKNAAFALLLAEGGVNVFADARRLIATAQGLDLELGLASSSKNARLVLEAAGLLGIFHTIMDGTLADYHGVGSKPDAAFYRFAAELLGRSAVECIAIEDAVSGVISAKRAGIRTVIGVARRDDAAALRAAGADLVVTSLDDVAPEIFGAAVA